MNFLEAQPGDVPITSSDNQLLNDWIEFMPSTSIDVGVKKFIEIGPGKVLSGLIKRIDRSVGIVSVNDLSDFISRTFNQININ